MNIFVLDLDPIKAAQMQCDKHVVKMTLESAQLLCTAHHRAGKIHPDMYVETHPKHPCSIWARETAGNYSWLYNHFKALSSEYTHRYGKKHKSFQKLHDILGELPLKIPWGDRTDFAIACGGIDLGNPVNTYRAYYREKFKHMTMTWSKRDKPDWMNK